MCKISEESGRQKSRGSPIPLGSLPDDSLGRTTTGDTRELPIRGAAELPKRVRLRRPRTHARSTSPKASTGGRKKEPASALSAGATVGAQPAAGPPIPGPFFTSLGVDNVPSDVSADGTVVVGNKRDFGAFRWTLEAGIEPIGLSTAYAVSADGSVVVGVSGTGTDIEASRWTRQTGVVGLGDFPSGFFESRANGVSADGSVVVGMGTKGTQPDTGLSRALRWTSASGLVDLGNLPPSIAGASALGVSADGSVVAGSSGAVLFRWTQAEGMVPLNKPINRATLPPCRPTAPQSSAG